MLKYYLIYHYISKSGVNYQSIFCKHFIPNEDDAYSDPHRECVRETYYYGYRSNLIKDSAYFDRMYPYVLNRQMMHALDISTWIQVTSIRSAIVAADIDAS